MWIFLKYAQGEMTYIVRLTTRNSIDDLQVLCQSVDTTWSELSIWPLLEPLILFFSNGQSLWIFLTTYQWLNISKGIIARQSACKVMKDIVNGLQVGEAPDQFEVRSRQPSRRIRV
jgi:hypothetical protein